MATGMINKKTHSSYAEFTQSVVEQIEHYVYYLKDPRDDEIFYIGKGRGNRVFQHVQCSLDSPAENEKLDRIREISKSGNRVQHFILRHGLQESVALEVEAAVIDILGLTNLSNLQAGHKSGDFGLQTTEQISSMYESKPFEPDGTPLLLININRLYYRTMSEEDLYQATRKSWVVGERREKAVYAIPTFRGLTREVYKINRWLPSPTDGPRRWMFEGKIAQPEIRKKFRYKSIEAYFKKGAANPIRFIDC